LPQDAWGVATRTRRGRHKSVLERFCAFTEAHGDLAALDKHANKLGEHRVVDAVRIVRKLNVHTVHRFAGNLQYD